MVAADVEPYRAHALGPLVKGVLTSGEVSFSRHAEQEMANDRLAKVDVENVLRGGVYEEGEFENGSWRYRVRTHKITVVLAVRSESRIVVVTAWRNQR
ncbi:DUF4258 domain-containing protein [Haliangium sp.]|uniref:DUF4258 domain-containing protein n=1 Tax=Haliangium sp. TaxID=2663208 RepID=UPI003D0F8F76